MNATTITNIINGYEDQLANERNPSKIEWLKKQISDGHYALSQIGIYTN